MVTFTGRVIEFGDATHTVELVAKHVVPRTVSRIHGLSCREPGALFRFPTSATA
jgi:hypothetical protein